MIKLPMFLTTDFVCPTCATMGSDAEELCNNEDNFAYPVCEKENPFCIVYKSVYSWDTFFTRICADEADWQSNLKSCQAEPNCKMGRCFTSGCLATLD